MGHPTPKPVGARPTGPERWTSGYASEKPPQALAVFVSCLSSRDSFLGRSQVSPMSFGPPKSIPVPQCPVETDPVNLSDGLLIQ